MLLPEVLHSFPHQLTFNTLPLLLIITLSNNLFHLHIRILNTEVDLRIWLLSFFSRHRLIIAVFYWSCDSSLCQAQLLQGSQ